MPFARVEHDPNRDPAVISFAKRMNDHECDREAYKRNLDKRYVNALKQFRGIATRHDSKAPDQSSEHGLADEPVPTFNSLSILC